MSETIKVYSPYDNHFINEVPLVGEREIEKALRVAHETFVDRSNWLPKFKRIEILENLITLMKNKIPELTKIAAEEGGKPYTDSLIEVERAINGVKLGIEYLGQMKGEEVPMELTRSSEHRLAFTIKEPIGVVVSLSAFNHPLNLAIHQTIPAIATGCPVIIKPATKTPLSCFNLVNLFYEAGLPKNWCQTFVCTNELAEKLATDSRVRYLSFIGSAKVGWYLRSKLAPGTHCALEHGGAAPVIVEPDADLVSLIPALVKGGMYHAGQVCVKVQRIYIHESSMKNFSKQFTERVKALRTGDPLDKNTDVGPLIDPKEVTRMEAWVKEAKESGAEILCGGKRLSNTCFEPTVILNPPANVRVSCEEVFGPIVCLYTYSDRSEAIARANNVPYAFQAAICTKNIDVAFDTAKRLNAKAVMINDHTAFRVDWMPFGGKNHSGIGVGGIPYTMTEMMEDKLLVFKSA